MAVRKVENELEAMGVLREASAADALTGLRRALKDSVNLMVAKAAAIAAQRQFQELIPDLVCAFDRLMTDCVRRDPKCWGKSAIARALTELEYRESALYLRGVRHLQMEASWGGSVDTSDILRGVCVLGLAASTDIVREDTLRALVDAAGDSAEPVRVEAVRAIAQLGEPLLIRMKARLGDTSSAVMGQAFDSLLALEGEAAIPFVAGFLLRGNDREEAALSLGTSRQPGAVAILRDAWEQLEDLREVLLRALSLTREEEALEFLLEQVRNGRLTDAISALQALAIHQEWRGQTEAAAAGREPELQQALKKAFTPER
jgi:hypothetical protein